MDNELTENGGSSRGVESIETTTRKEFEDGSSETTRVEQVEGGYIITVDKRFKDSKGEWQYKTEKSVSQTDPTKDNSSEGIANRLESVLKGLL